MKQQSDMLQRAGIVVISIFQSTPESVKKYVQRKSEREDTLLLSDRKGKVYKTFSLKSGSIVAAVYGPEMCKNLRKYKAYMDIPALAKDMVSQNSGGPLAQAKLPAIFLIDEEGIIVDLFRAETFDDHMPLERIEAFIPKNRRCKCNRKDCITYRCREVYDDIRQQAEAMIFTG